MIPKNTHTLVPTATHRIYRLLTATLVALSTFFFSSCNEPVRDYFEKWTKEVSIAKYELIGIESYTDKDGNLCIASDQDVPVTLFMINPYHYSNIVVSSGDITTTATGTFPSITQDANDTTLLRFTYGRDFLLENECGGEIGATINLKHPMNSTVKEYTFSIKSNSKPPLIEDAAIMTTGTGNDQEFVLAFRCPPLNDCKENGGIHHDIVSIMIDGETYPVTPASNGELIFSDPRFTRTRPTPLNAINKNFDDSELAVYFCQNEGTNDETKNGKTYTITFTDSAGFTNSRTIDARLPGMSSPLVYDNDNADSEAATLDETAVNILHIDNTQDAACSTVTIKLPEVNDIGLPVAEKNPKIYWELKDISGNLVSQDSSVTSPSSSNVSLKIPTEGEYTLKVYATADAHTNSSEKTYRLKLEYAQLPPPVVKKTNGTSLTAGSGSNTNNYIEVGNDNNATVKIYVPTTDVNNNSFLNGNNVNLYYSSAPGSTSAEPTESAELSNNVFTLNTLSPGQYVITAVAKKPGYRDSEVVTYKVRAFNCNIYVKSSDDASLNPGSDSTGDGSQERPYASITRAVEEIGRINIHTNTYTIHVVGVVTGNQVIENISGKATSITIQGDDTGDALDGNNSGTVLANKDTVSITIRNLTIKSGNASGLVNQGTVTLQSGVEISGNSATSGGGISNSGTLTIESGVTISGNTATYGGGIYLNSNSGTLTIKGGTITGNTASDGAAIYALKTFTVTQAAQINSSNDVYLANGKYINIDGTLSNSNVAKITPGPKSGETNPWHRGTQVLSGNVPDNPGTKFSVNKSGWSVRKASSSSGKLDAPLYISASGNDSTNSGATASDAYATIDTAVKEIKNVSDSNRDYIINIVGTVNGAHTISGVNGKAKSITLVGTGSGGKLDAQNANDTRPLTVSSSVPVIITNLTITGGNVANGGGIYVNASANVKLADGATITGNTATKGGGVYIVSSGKLFMYGNSLIGDNSKTEHATSGAYANIASSSGGGIYNTGGTVYLGYDDVDSPTAINNGYGVRYNYAQSGGGIYNSGTVYLNTGNISYNGSDTTGGGICNASNKTIYMNGGKLSGNFSAKGGAVHINGGTLTMTGGVIGGSENSEKNTASGTGAAGGAVYQDGMFNVSGNAYITPGTAPLDNDVYLASTSNYINVANSLTPKSDGTSNGTAVSYTAAITPSEWTRGTQVLTGNYASSYYDKFKGSETDWLTIKDTNDSSKVKLYTSYNIYVAGSENRASDIGAPKTKANGGLGTKAKPYASIDEAVAQCWDKASTKSKTFTIFVSGDIKDARQTISSSITNAKEILLQGYGTYHSINRNLTSVNTNSGSALSIGTAVPVKITNMTITGGYASYGGGIYISANGQVYLGDGVVITGNKATNSGGGVYVWDGAKLFLYGTARIGGSGTSLATDSTGNYSEGFGAGIYSQGSVYLGYSACNSSTGAPTTETTLSGGVTQNYATNNGGGGGIYIGQGKKLYMKSGNISYNYSGKKGGGVFLDNLGATMTMAGGTIAGNKAETDGGGVYIYGTSSTGYLVMTGGYFYSNSATNNGGAVYIDSNAEFEMTGGTIGGSGKENTCGSSYNGGAIYNGSTFKLGGSAQIPGTLGKANNIYLASNKTIDLKSSLTTFSPKAKISLETYKYNMQVVKPLTGITDSDIYDACSSLSLSSNSYLLYLADDGYTSVRFSDVFDYRDISNYPNVSWGTSAIDTTAATNERGNRVVLIKINSSINSTTYAIGQLHFEPLTNEGYRPMTFNYQVFYSNGSDDDPQIITDSTAGKHDGGMWVCLEEESYTWGNKPDGTDIKIEFTSDTNCRISLEGAQRLYAIPQ